MRHIAPLVLLLFPLVTEAQVKAQRMIQSSAGVVQAITEEDIAEFAVVATHENFNTGQFGTQVAAFGLNGAPQFGRLFRSWSSGNFMRPTDIVKLNNGGYAVVGENTTGPPVDSSWIMLVDAIGDLDWMLSFGSPLPGTLGTNLLAVEQAPNGDLFVGGEIDILDSVLHQDLFISRLTLAGSVIWTQHISSTTSGDFARFGDFLAPTGGGIMFSAQSTTDGCLMARLDDLGNFAWGAFYDTNTDDLRALAPMEDGTGYQVPLRAEFAFNDISLRYLTTDPNGLATGGKKITVTGVQGKLEALVRTFWGGFVGAGRGSNTNAIDDGISIWTDANGDGTHAVRYGSLAGWEGLNCVTRGQGGGYVFGGAGELGSLQLQGGIPQQAYLLFTDSSGFTGGCEDTLAVVTTSLSYPTGVLNLTVSPMGGWLPSSVIEQPELTVIDVCPELSVLPNYTPDLTVHPNPATDLLQVSGMGSEDWWHRLLDAQGRVVLERTSRQDRTTLDVSALAPGLYLLESRTDRTRVTGHVVVAR